MSRFTLSAAVAGLLVSETRHLAGEPQLMTPIDSGYFGKAQEAPGICLRFAGAIAKWTESSPDLYRRSGQCSASVWHRMESGGIEAEEKR